MEIVTMYDTIHDDAHNIPLGAPKVGGYVTGSPDVQWTMADWDRFPRAGRVRIDQSPGGELYAAGHADAYDMEANAGTPARFAQAVLERIAAGHGNTGYGSAATLEEAAAELDKAVPGRVGGWWRGHIWAWLADPSLSLAQATAMVGQMHAGFIIAAVQWATPTSNPDTAVDGGTLKSLNLDLSAASAAWFPGQPKPDTWQAHALQLATDMGNQAAALQALLRNHMA